MKSTLRTALMLVALMAIAVGVIGCQQQPVADPAQLEGTWVLESFGGATELEPAAEGVTTELTMDGAGKANGNGGVNSFNGAYTTADDNTLEFGEIASTKMAGEPAAMEQETRFFEVLANTRHFEVNEGKLILASNNNDTLAVLVAK